MTTQERAANVIALCELNIARYESAIVNNEINATVGNRWIAKLRNDIAFMASTIS